MKLEQQWDIIADDLDSDGMRPTRYGKCFRYLYQSNKNLKILEIGCGEGSGLVLAKQLGFKNLIGMEVSKERLLRAKNKLKNDASLIHISTDINWPIKTNSIDVVISLAVIEHTIDPELFIREIHRITKNNGLIILNTDCYQWRILQILGKYKSIQPIDKAPSPFLLNRYFKMYNLKLLHCEGFPYPREKFRFLRYLLKPIDAYFLYIANLFNVQQDKNKNINAKNEFNEALNSVKHTGTPAIKWILSLPKLIFSDENIFYLEKTD